MSSEPVVKLFMKADDSEPLERRVISIGMATHMMAGLRSTACGIVGPRFFTNDTERVDCLLCLKVLRNQRKEK